MENLMVDKKISNNKKYTDEEEIMTKFKRTLKYRPSVENTNSKRFNDKTIFSFHRRKKNV